MVFWPWLIVTAVLFGLGGYMLSEALQDTACRDCRQALAKTWNGGDKN